MDPALLKEREAFKRRAMAQPVVENAKVRVTDQSSAAKAKAAKKNAQLGAQSQSAKAKLDLAQMKSMSSASSQFKFGVLTKIIRHMKVSPSL